MPDELLRKITILERLGRNGRKFEEISQSFLSASGQVVPDESADALASDLLQSSRKTQHSYQGLFGLPCLETVKELIYWIVSWPEGLDQDGDRLKALVFGLPDFDARLIQAPESCRPAGEGTQGGLCERRNPCVPAESALNKPLESSPVKLKR